MKRVPLAIVIAVLLGIGSAQAADRTIRIGYQKYGTLLLLKAEGSLDGRLKPLGYDVTWTEFPAGPQLLEAMNAGALDFGLTGEAPPIFAQAAGSSIVYVANEPPAPKGEAILVPKGSAIANVADLKGKSVALNKGSNVHYLLVRALEAAGLSYADIHPVFLAPADARAAFERGSVDAWAIWDPYLAAAQAATGARTLVTGENLVPNTQFYLAPRRFAAENAAAVDAVVAALDAVDRKIERDPASVVDTVATSVRLPAAVVATAIGRQGFGVSRVTPAVMAEQQKVADTFAALKLLPKPVSVGEAVLTPTP
ncbi:aliphatic sulfonate ABC transporter substrate-binding protein [Lichenihabitans sp. Uapishka_5]|uniref:aliphatic sulfonate ABC transporter substrate-binding protein n=1 Tax=Lichenihabitans sp. Uapishka_5 TaxID=3037302 RepID=UPI0029E7E5FC|nr:aliphatic sulfonate ABC transporter substrate-binding protein [Lichenihabitans sp. Uapishka_5]MDX7952852.1 aliphatic sulfonate ABC transporter substrate-binding protein [Lichenihabitans sp. Uapishka_5]